MGKRGPKPKPTAVKELQGNPGKRPLNKKEPKLPADKPSMPRGVMLDEAKLLWRKNLDALSEAGILKSSDGPAFALLCQHYAVAMEAAKLLKDDGLIGEGANGGEKKHPAATIFTQNSSAFLKYAAHFGMTPSSRSELRLEPDEQQMTLADALFALVNQADGDGGDDGE